jgi:autotransporter-associated beta strand protein
MGRQTFSGVIAGSTSSSSLTKSGSGTLKLSGTNTYEGATTVEAGVLEVSNASALGTSTRGSTANGTTIQQGVLLIVAGGASVR